MLIFIKDNPLPGRISSNKIDMHNRLMNRVVRAEMIKAVHGSNKIGLYSPRLIWLLPLMNAQPDKCRDCCRVFRVALILGISLQPLGDRPVKYDPFCNGENSNYPFPENTDTLYIHLPPCPQCIDQHHHLRAYKIPDISTEYFM